MLQRATDATELMLQAMMLQALMLQADAPSSDAPGYCNQAAATSSNAQKIWEFAMIHYLCTLKLGKPA